jgi:hypothetical protein
MNTMKPRPNIAFNVVGAGGTAGVGPHSGLAPVGAGAEPPQGDKRDEASSKSWLSRGTE